MKRALYQPFGRDISDDPTFAAQTAEHLASHHAESVGATVVPGSVTWRVVGQNFPDVDPETGEELPPKWMLAVDYEV